MDLQSTSSDSDKLMLNNNCSIQCSSLQINDRRDSAIGSSRTISPIAFFHDGMTTSEIDLRYNIMGAQRRARAIATAPRRNRYDEQEDDTKQKQNLFGFAKTSPVPIPTQSVAQKTQSLPQIQSGISPLPSFRVDPPALDELDYT